MQALRIPIVLGIFNRFWYLSLAMNYFHFFLAVAAFLACSTENHRGVDHQQKEKLVQFSSSLTGVKDAFTWARDKALSFAHDGTDPVGVWYEAALPNREAFCMRDVSHQCIGAEILGLSEHNYNMMQKFAQNISASRDYCSFWEINRYDLPAPVDYRSDQDFWYNLPANFDVVFSLNRLYNWSGNKQYMQGRDFKRFCELSLNEYVDHWDLGYDEVVGRNRLLHMSTDDSLEFGSHRGIPTYNEGGRGMARLGIDMTASLLAAYRSYAQMLEWQGDSMQAKAYRDRAANEDSFLYDFWWDANRDKFKSIWYQDSTFDYFFVGSDQAFLHYLFYFEVLKEAQYIRPLVKAYEDNYQQLIVELKSYLPIISYEFGDVQLANKMIVELCSEENQRRDYPENSFTVVEHITRGLMGLEAYAADTMLSTFSRLPKESDWAEMTDLSALGRPLDLRHEGQHRTVLTNKGITPLKWQAQFQGEHDFLYVEGEKENAVVTDTYYGKKSYVLVQVEPGKSVAVALQS